MCFTIFDQVVDIYDKKFIPPDSELLAEIEIYQLAKNSSYKCLGTYSLMRYLLHHVNRWIISHIQENQETLKRVKHKNDKNLEHFG